MSTSNATSEYLLLLRGPDWDKGLSPEEIQQVMDQIMAWFEGLKQQGKIEECPIFQRAKERLAHATA